MSEAKRAPVTFAGSATIAPEGEARCEQVLRDWMDALNRHDAAQMDACMRFPHVRLAANQVSVYDAPGSNPMDLFQRLMDDDGWDHSAWTRTELVQSSPNKAHYAVQYTRYRRDGSIIGVFNSLYVFTCPVATGRSNAARVSAPDAPAGHRSLRFADCERA